MTTNHRISFDANDCTVSADSAHVAKVRVMRLPDDYHISIGVTYEHLHNVEWNTAWKDYSNDNCAS